jgi:hypothetical protein
MILLNSGNWIRLIIDLKHLFFMKFCSGVFLIWLFIIPVFFFFSEVCDAISNVVTTQIIKAQDACMVIISDTLSHLTLYAQLYGLKTKF